MGQQKVSGTTEGEIALCFTRALNRKRRDENWRIWRKTLDEQERANKLFSHMKASRGIQLMTTAMRGGALVAQPFTEGPREREMERDAEEGRDREKKME